MKKETAKQKEFKRLSRFFRLKMKEHDRQTNEVAVEMSTIDEWLREWFFGVKTKTQIEVHKMEIPVWVQLNWENIDDFKTFKKAMQTLPFHFKMSEYEVELKGYDKLAEKGLIKLD